MRSSQLTTPRHPLVEQRRARRRHISGHRKTQFLPSPRYMDVTCMQSPPDPLSTSSTTPSPFPPSRLPAPVSRPARPINPNHHQQQQQPCATSTGTSSSSPTAPKSPCRNSKPAATWCRTRSNCLRIPTPVSQHHTYISIPFPPTHPPPPPLNPHLLNTSQEPPSPSNTSPRPRSPSSLASWPTSSMAALSACRCIVGRDRVRGMGCRGFCCSRGRRFVLRRGFLWMGCVMGQFFFPLSSALWMRD